jgi:DNA-binding XRE family transcriptional regulator
LVVVKGLPSRFLASPSSSLISHVVFLHYKTIDWKKKGKKIVIEVWRSKMRMHIKPVGRNHLRRLRRVQGLSLWGLAVGVGTSPTTLSAIEKWGYRPGAALCERIATALGVPVSDIWPEGEAQR